MTVDGGASVLVDLYSSSFLNQQAVWSTGTLAAGPHSVKIEWTGQRNPASSFTYVSVDAFDVAGVLTAKPVPGAPTVTGVSPTSGPSSGGTGPVTITGTNFTGATAVAFGGSNVPGGGFVVNSATQITVNNIPAGTGTVDVRVTNSLGQSAVNAPADQYTYVAPAAPTVTGVSPTSGPSSGGTGPVTITGTNFTGATAVAFGGSNVPGGGFVVNSATQITVNNIPAGTGTVDVRVTTGGGQSAVNAPADQYTYVAPAAPTVTGVSPTSGPSSGGTGPVTITGTNFTGATAVAFGGSNVPGGGFVVNSATQITVNNIPAGTGTVDVRVTTGGGQSAVNAPADQYTYVAPVLTRYEETNPLLVYTGSWANLNGGAYSGGSLKYTYRSGASVIASFTGTSLSWIARVGSSYGIARVTVDGGTPVLVDLYSPSFLNQQSVWSTGTLSPGPHSVKIEWTGQRNPASSFTYVSVDAFDVTGTLN